MAYDSHRHNPPHPRELLDYLSFNHVHFMNTPDTEELIEKIVEKVRYVEFLHGVPVELPGRTKELLRSDIRGALTSRDTYWKERVDRAFVILDTNIQELVTYEEGRVSKESVLTCVRRIKRELDNLK